MVRFLAIAAALTCLGTGASASTVYFDDFEGPSALTGAGGIVDAEGYDGVNGIAGSFWRNDTKSLSTDLSLTGLSAHNWMTVEFDIAFIDSWDGAIGRIYGDDFFNILVDGALAVVTTNFGGLGDELRDGVYGFFGFNQKWDDEAYRLSASFAHSGDSAEFSFFADGRKWQAGLDESWAIDNLAISISDEMPAPVPLTGSVLFFATALAALTLASGGVAKRRRVTA